MKKTLLAICVLATAFVCQSRANVYDLTFAEHDAGPTIANGQIYVTSGIATSGILNVTGGPGTGSYSLIGGTGSGPNFIWDSIVNVGNDPFLTTTGGLEFATGGVLGGLEFNMWANSPGSYTLYGNYGGNYNPTAIGTATLTSVPDGGATVALLGGAFIGLAVLRRRFVA